MLNMSPKLGKAYLLKERFREFLNSKDEIEAKKTTQFLVCTC
jgi:hypothetical protein